MSERTWSRLNFTPSNAYANTPEERDRGGSNGHMSTRNTHGGGFGYNVLGGSTVDSDGNDGIAGRPNMQARGFRQERLFNSHEDIEVLCEDRARGYERRTNQDGV